MSPGDPNQPGYPPPGGYPPPPGHGAYGQPPYGAPPPGGYGAPQAAYGSYPDPAYAAPPPRGRGVAWLIGLLFFLIALAAGAALYFSGLVDRPLEAVGLKTSPIHKPGSNELTDHGLETYRNFIAGKRWAPPGRCGRAEVALLPDGTALHDNERGRWELTRSETLILTEPNGRTETFTVSIDVGANRFAIGQGGAAPRAMENCGSA